MILQVYPQWTNNSWPLFFMIKIPQTSLPQLQRWPFLVCSPKDPAAWKNPPTSHLLKKFTALRHFFSLNSRRLRFCENWHMMPQWLFDIRRSPFGGVQKNAVGEPEFFKTINCISHMKGNRNWLVDFESKKPGPKDFLRPNIQLSNCNIWANWIWVDQLGESYTSVVQSRSGGNRYCQRWISSRVSNLFPRLKGLLLGLPLQKIHQLMVWGLVVWVSNWVAPKITIPLIRASQKNPKHQDPNPPSQTLSWLSETRE